MAPATIKAGQKISFNVPAVCEGFAGRISEREAFAALKNFGWSGAWEPKAT
jgi:hypothetical protein